MAQDDYKCSPTQSHGVWGCEDGLVDKVLTTEAVGPGFGSLTIVQKAGVAVFKELLK